MLPLFGATPTLPSDETIRAIGGHPAIAKIASSALARQGSTIFSEDPRGLHLIQEDILRESLDVRQLSSIDGEILSVLSWLPQLPANDISDLFTSRHGLSKPEVAVVINNLMLSCVILSHGDNLSISAPVRAYFRRNYGYGSRELRGILFEYLKSEWEITHQRAELRAELFDALVYMSALEGGTLPPEFRSLLLPSTLQEVVRETYDSGHENRQALQRVVDWGRPAQQMPMDETTREEILSYVARALIRLGNKDGEVDDLLRLFQRKGYRSYNYINGFYLQEAQQARSSYRQFFTSQSCEKILASRRWGTGRMLQGFGSLERIASSYSGRSQLHRPKLKSARYLCWTVDRRKALA